MPADRKKLKELVARINRASNADFVRRLLDEKRKVLKNDDGTVSTHELGYVTEDGGAVVSPSVQSVGDSLARFPYPESYERAVERGDTVHMSIPGAELFTVGYKDYYPGFDRYSDGGSIHIKPSHSGRLTELKERTGKTEAELYSDGNPAHKKMVVFARNARKWNHADGGFLTDYPDSGTILPVMPGNYTGDTDFVKRYAGGGDMAQMMGAVGPEYMSSLANSAPAYSASPVETIDVQPSQEAETPAQPVWQIPQYGHVPEYSQPAVVPPAVKPATANEQVFDPAAVQAEYDSMLDNILLRQRYAESGFNDKAVNKSSGAAGAYQIMPIAYKDYLQRGRGKEGDLMNAAYNRLVRDHVIKMAPKDLGKEFYTDRDTALERHAKEMAVFNAGGGSVRKALRKAVNAGMDITSSFDWLQFLPKETRDYVNFIVLGQEIENSGKNEKAYQAALTKFNNRHDLGGLVSRINKAYGGDRKKMSDAFGRIKAANKFDGGGDKD